jgi:2-haloacid dehalogenase
MESRELESLRAITFDVFGTVVDWRNTIIDEGEDRWRPCGLDVDWAAFADAWRGLYQPAMERVRSGQLGFIKLDDLHRQNLDQVLADFGHGDFPESERGDLNRVWHRLRPWPDVVSGLTRLKRRYIIGTLSNGNIALMVNMAKNGGLPWDVILGAEVARQYKPHPDAYLNSAKALDLPPDQCMLAAAHNADLLAAQALGFRCGFIARPTEYGPDQSEDQYAEHEFDVVATDFNDLADKLGCD